MVRDGSANRSGPQPTMDDVAHQAGVSRATVSRVLAGTVKVNQATRTRVLTAINALGYVPNLVAQALATKGSPLVGLLLRNPRKPVYGLLHAELQDRTAEAGLELITVVPSTSEGPGGEQRALQKLLGLRVGGLFVATGVSHASHLEPFLGVVPTVAVGRPEHHPGIPSVSHDEVANATALAETVASQGHRRVAVLTPDAAISLPENLRATTITQSLSDLGVAVETVPATILGLSDEGSADIVALVRHRGITCAMFPSDLRALQFWSACDEAGLAVPDDVSVTGVDGAAPGLERIGLTTVRLPVALVAKRAVAVMTGLMCGEPPPVAHDHQSGELIAGRSLGSPRTHRLR